MIEDSASDGGAAARLACRDIVRALMKQYEWKLLPEPDLAALVLASAKPRAAPTEIEMWARRHYAEVLYQACQQTQELARREQGYQELSRFLYRVAYSRWPDLAEAVVQRGLMLVHQQLDRCYSPATFFAFAFNKLRQAFTEERRAREKAAKDIPLTEIEPNSLETESPQELLSQTERLQVLVEAMKRLLNDREQKVILWKFFGGLSDEQIAERLSITAGYVRRLRYTGMTRLRQDRQLREFFDPPSNTEASPRPPSDLSTEYKKRQ